MVTAIVLAAGLSKRMGRLKQLLPFGRQTVVEAVVASLKACRIDRILVVVGHRGDEIAALFAGGAVRETPVSVLRNPHYEQGMLSSLQAGLSHLDPQTEWVLLALADQPAVPSQVVSELLEAATEPGAYIPVYEGLRGHPILIHAAYLPDVRGLDPSVGLRELWRVRPEIVRHVPVSSDASLVDLDTPEDYERAVSRLGEEG